jgi:hypothetical protein
MEGRALLGHELAHVAQAQAGETQLRRQEKIEPHYPTAAEQQEIGKILAREFGATETASSSAASEPIRERRIALTADQRAQLALRLRQPYLAAINRLDTGEAAPSGRVLDEAEAFDVLARARADIYRHFGGYARQLTFTRDVRTTAAARRAANQVLVTFGESATVARDFGRTIASGSHCAECAAQLAPLDQESKDAVVDALVDFALREEGGRKLQRVAEARVPGGFREDLVRLRLKLKPEEELYHTAVHEFMHALVHPAFRAVFPKNDPINEGFTEYFTHKLVSSVDPSYKAQYDRVVGIRDAMKGPFRFMGDEDAEESLRLAYFSGRLDLIGWRASGPDEERAVQAAGGSKQWDAATARRYAEIYQVRARALQAASRNVLGVGFYLGRGSNDKTTQTIAARYARVFARTEPYARGQLLLEGQLLGSPIGDLRTLGASVGAAAEYQEPYFYLTGGVRLVGTTALGGGTDRLDLSPFVSLGVRAWQIIRVGAEGYVVIPASGQGSQFGGGISLGVEL